MDCSGPLLSVTLACLVLPLARVEGDLYGRLKPYPDVNRLAPEMPRAKSLHPNLHVLGKVRSVGVPHAVTGTSAAAYATANFSIFNGKQSYLMLSQEQSDKDMYTHMCASCIQHE